MIEVLCQTSKGLRESEVTVAVQDVRGNHQFLRVENGFLTNEGGRHYLPVGLVGVDPGKGMALIELPHEADSGANRLWVWESDMRGVDVAS
jgi:hypothetical protein